MQQIDFTRGLIKGKIVEIVFEMMFRNTNRFKIIHFGYEHTIPELTERDIHIPENKAVLHSISEAPDFVEIDDQNRVVMVEVKYRKDMYGQGTRKIAEKLVSRWPEAWLFLATQKGFCFDSGQAIIANNGFIPRLSETIIPQETQEAYLTMLCEFNMA